MPGACFPNLWGPDSEKDAAFGTLTCERPRNISEGMLVVKKDASTTPPTFCLTNIEYSSLNFNEGSRFPSNTNIMFFDINAVKKATEQNPLPGLMINMKSLYPTIDGRKVLGGRLETTMQNAADDIRQQTPEDPPSFAIFGPRCEVSSTIKRSYEKELAQTPVQTFYDLLKRNRKAFSMKLPPKASLEDYLSDGPNVIIDFHPALGPDDVIGQKVKGGELVQGSEMVLEIAELQMQDLHLDGSLRILADSPLGHLDDGVLQYSDKCGKCRLINVTVKNQGIDRGKVTQWWKGDHPRKESCEIIIHGSGEFFAENLTFLGNFQIEVPSGTRITAKEKNGKIILFKEKILHPSWSWAYRPDPQSKIILENKTFF